jgi:hypothetical protein
VIDEDPADSPPDMDLRGVEAYVSRLSVELAARGHQVTEISVDTGVPGTPPPGVCITDLARAIITLHDDDDLADRMGARGPAAGGAALFMA